MWLYFRRAGANKGAGSLQQLFVILSYRINITGKNNFL
jgi:hypothetical protein